jgi:hypothetical protein
VKKKERKANEDHDDGQQLEISLPLFCVSYLTFGIFPLFFQGLIRSHEKQVQII